MLIDDILADVSPASVRSTWFLNQLKRSTVIRIHNVADYVFESPPLEWKLDQDFPNLAPPFENIWMEWSHRCDWGFKHIKPCTVPVRIRMGIMLFSFDHTKSDYGPISDPLITSMRKLLPGAKWFIQGFFIWEGSDRILDCPPGPAWGVSAEGQLILNDKLYLVNPHPLSNHEGLSDDDKGLTSGITRFLSIPFMAISFMHCKNVNMIKCAPYPIKLQESRVEKGKQPLVRWNTLTIESVKRIIASGNNGDPALTPKSLHICRGHFKQFIERGLFGKHHGTYWWPMHTRGSKDAGVIIKDYRVMADARGSNGG